MFDPEPKARQKVRQFTSAEEFELLYPGEPADTPGAGAAESGHETSLFPGLVLGCIKADFYDPEKCVRIFQDFSKSTR